jgi:signal transduction histidine kinase/ligand-binding sensor domain-containing protein
MRRRGVERARMTRAGLSSALLAMLGLLWVQRAAPLSLDRSIEEYRHTRWTARENVAIGAVWAFAQSSDGFIWLSTSGGLLRFDGMRFERFAFPHDERISDPYTAQIFAPPAGGLLIGFYFGGVAALKDGQITVYPPGDDLPRGSVISFAQRGDGSIWVGTTTGVARFDGAHWSQPFKGDRLPGDHRFNEIFVDSDDTLWATTGSGTFALAQGASDFRQIEANVRRGGLVESRSGDIWLIEYDRSLHWLARTNRLPAEPLGGDTLGKFDKDGALWIGGSHGLCRIKDVAALPHDREVPLSEVTECFDESQGLSSNTVGQPLQDREGNIWVTTAEGIERFSEPVLMHEYGQTLRAGRSGKLNRPFLVAASDGAVWSNAGLGGGKHDSVLLQFSPPSVTTQKAREDALVACPGRNGGVYVAGESHLLSYEGGLETAIDLPPEAQSYRVQACAVDAAGDLWISVVRQGVYERIEGHWIKAPVAGLPQEPAVSLASDALGRLWFGYIGNRIYRLDHAGLKAYGPSSGVALGTAMAFSLHGSHIWAAGSFGLQYLDGERFRSLNSYSRDDLDGGTGVVETKGGELWLSTAQGLVRISRQEMERALANPQHLVNAELFDATQVVGAGSRIRPLPTLVEDLRGRLWLSTVSEIYSVDPQSIRRNTTPPNVVINSVMAGGHDYGANSEVRLPRGTREFSIDFVGLSLTMSERVRYRYRLSGLDNHWQDVGARRQAFYTNLNPGHYVFSVLASNDDGLWSPQGAEVTIIIPPTFTQTGAFVALCVFALVALIGFLLWIRVRQVSSMLRQRHEARLAERDRIARDLHDTLLQSTEGLILKVYTAAQQLPAGHPTRTFLTHSLDLAEELAVEGRQKLLGLRQHSQLRLELSQALAALGLELSADTTTTFSTVKKGRVKGLQVSTWDEVFSIAREAINNAFKHADADRIEAIVTYGSSTLTVHIRDDGRGMPKEMSLLFGKPGHFGLRAMRERAEQLDAELVIDTGADRGTSVSLVVPGSVAYLRRSTTALATSD